MKFKNIITIVLLVSVCSLNLFSCGIIDETTPLSKIEAIPLSIEPQANLDLLETSNIVAEPEIVKASEGCIHEINPSIYSFHHFNGTLMDYVGRDKFQEWTKINEDYFDEKTGCNSKSNIIEFIRYFNITKDEMEKLIASDSNLYYLYDYNIDIIYSGDDKLIEDYYNNPENRKIELYNKRTIFDLKSAMLGYIYGPNGEYQEETKHLFDEWSKTKEDFSYFNLTQWSLVEFIEYFDVSREYVETYFKGNNITLATDITFNIDMMYSNDQRINWMIEQGVDSAVIDSMYQTSDGIFRDDLIYQQTVEAINNDREISINEINQAIEIAKSSK